MIFETKYEAYNASWLKSLGINVLPLIIGFTLLPHTDGNSRINPHTNKPALIHVFSAPLLQKLPGLLFLGVSGGSFIHNLYEQYQHNKSLEKKLTVEIGGEVKEITASPNYFDAYTVYNICSAGIMLTQIAGIAIGDKMLFFASFLLGIAVQISGIVSYFNSHQDYNFTDQNGNAVSAEEIAHSEILNIEHNCA